MSLNGIITPPKAAQAGAVTGKMEFDDFTRFMQLIRESLPTVDAHSVFLQHAQEWSPT